MLEKTRFRGQTAVEYVMILGAVLLFAVIIVSFLRTGVFTSTSELVDNSSTDFFQVLSNISGLTVTGGNILGEPTFGVSNPLVFFSFTTPMAIGSAGVYSDFVNVTSLVRTFDNKSFSIDLSEGSIALDNGPHVFQLFVYSIDRNRSFEQNLSFSVYAQTNPSPSCSLDSECLGGQICGNGVCADTSAIVFETPVSSGSACVFDLDCLTSLVCVQASDSEEGVCALIPTPAP